MAILIDAGQQITTLDVLTIHEIRYFAQLAQLGQAIRRVEDVKAFRRN
jgi:hypothetical protein